MGALGGLGAEGVSLNHPRGTAVPVTVGSVVPQGSAFRSVVLSWMVAMVETAIVMAGGEPWPVGRVRLPTGLGGDAVGTRRRGVWSSSSRTVPVSGERFWI